MKPKTPKESPEQAQQRRRAESDNVRSMQEYLKVRTGVYRRLQSPRISIATGRTFSGTPLG